MFFASTNDIKVLRDSIEAISQIIDEGIFKIKPTGIELLASDRAMVAVIDFKLAAEAFEKYECDKETSVGLNLNNLLTVLKRASEKTEIKLNEQENKLELTLIGTSTRNFAIPLIEISSEELPSISQFVFPASAEMKTDIIEEGIEDADIIADSVVFEAADSAFKMRAEGNSSRAELKLEKGESLKLEGEKVKARYPLDYLKKFLKAGKLADKTIVRFGKDYPLKLELKGDKVYLAMILAPRVEEE